MQVRFQLLLARATDRALATRPELTMRVVRASLERKGRRGPGEPLGSRTVKAWLAGRLISLHPGLGRALVRQAVRRAAESRR